MTLTYEAVLAELVKKQDVFSLCGHSPVVYVAGPSQASPQALVFNINNDIPTALKTARYSDRI